MTFRSALIAASLAATLSPALADMPGSDWMPLDRAYRTLTEAGFTQITKIEADDGRWEAKATKDGTLVKVFVDPRSGAITIKPRKKRSE